MLTQRFTLLFKHDQTYKRTLVFNRALSLINIHLVFIFLMVSVQASAGFFTSPSRMLLDLNRKVHVQHRDALLDLQTGLSCLLSFRGLSANECDYDSPYLLQPDVSGGVIFTDTHSSIQTPLGRLGECYGCDAEMPAPIVPKRLVNLALNTVVSQSSIDWGGNPSRAIDGNTDGRWVNGSVTHTAYEHEPFWQIDLGQLSAIDSIKIYPRTDCCQERLQKFSVLVSNLPFEGRSLTAAMKSDAVMKEFEAEILRKPKTISINRDGRYVRIQLHGKEALSLAEVEVLGNPQPEHHETHEVSKYNVALGKSAYQSSEAYGGKASRAIDGNTDGNWSQGSVIHTGHEEQPYWEIDLRAVYDVTRIELYPRTDCCQERTQNIHVFVSNHPFNGKSVEQAKNTSDVFTVHRKKAITQATQLPVNRTGRYIRIQLEANDPTYLSLAEVRVMSPQLTAQTALDEQQKARADEIDELVDKGLLFDCAYLTPQSLGSDPFMASPRRLGSRADVTEEYCGFPNDSNETELSDFSAESDSGDEFVHVRGVNSNTSTAVPPLTPVGAFDMLDNTALSAMIDPNGMNYLGLSSQSEHSELQTSFSFSNALGEHEHINNGDEVTVVYGTEQQLLEVLSSYQRDRELDLTTVVNRPPLIFFLHTGQGGNQHWSTVFLYWDGTRFVYQYADSLQILGRGQLPASLQQAFNDLKASQIHFDGFQQGHEIIDCNNCLIYAVIHARMMLHSAQSAHLTDKVVRRVVMLTRLRLMSVTRQLFESFSERPELLDFNAGNPSYPEPLSLTNTAGYNHVVSRLESFIKYQTSRSLESQAPWDQVLSAKVGADFAEFLSIHWDLRPSKFADSFCGANRLCLLIYQNFPPPGIEQLQQVFSGVTGASTVFFAGTNNHYIPPWLLHFGIPGVYGPACADCFSATCSLLSMCWDEFAFEDTGNALCELAKKFVSCSLKALKFKHNIMAVITRMYYLMMAMDYMLNSQKTITEQYSQQDIDQAIMLAVTGHVFLTFHNIYKAHSAYSDRCTDPEGVGPMLQRCDLKMIQASAVSAGAHLFMGLSLAHSYYSPVGSKITIMNAFRNTVAGDAGYVLILASYVKGVVEREHTVVKVFRLLMRLLKNTVEENPPQQPREHEEVR